MGQLAVKFKEWREKMELTREKPKHASSQSKDPERRSLTSWACKQKEKYGAIEQSFIEHDQETQQTQTFLTKLEALESLVNNQKQSITDHDKKIQEIERIVGRFVENPEKEVQLEKDAEPSHGAYIGAVLDAITEEGEDGKSRDLWNTLQHQAQVLKNHEEQLETNVTKIEIIREMLEERKGSQEKRLKRKLTEYEQQLKKRSESYDQLKKEIQEQLGVQEKIQDNLLAGFIVGFVILVMVCMLPKSLLAPG